MVGTYLAFLMLQFFKYKMALLIILSSDTVIGII